MGIRHFGRGGVALTPVFVLPAREGWHVCSVKPPLRLFWALALLVLAGCATTPSEPRNLDLLKAEIRDYVKSGRYQSDIAAVTAKADAWLVERAAKKTSNERLAVVFDLDETLLSNWEEIESLGLGSSAPVWEVWVADGRAPAIEPVRDVYRTARRLGLEIYFITGRREHQRAGTEKNLRAIDCIVSSALIMKADDEKGTSAAFKTAARAKLAGQGVVIIANLGDQESDLVGGYAERTFKLPDPFYLSQ
jgi:predicted secreted acid phosphatase